MAFPEFIVPSGEKPRQRVSRVNKSKVAFCGATSCTLFFHVRWIEPVKIVENLKIFWIKADVMQNTS